MRRHLFVGVLQGWAVITRAGQILGTLLLDDGTSHLLLDDGSSKVILD